LLGLDEAGVDLNDDAAEVSDSAEADYAAGETDVEPVSSDVDSDE
jgi:hypothetical protein